MISEEKINLNYTRWIERLKHYDCYSERLIDEIGDKIKNASFALQESSGAAYQGSMIDVVLNNLCVIACHLNDRAFGVNKDKVLHPYLQVNQNSLIRVLLLQHIAKAEMFILQTNQWKAKQGYLFDFNPNMNTCLKCGERTTFLCMKYGIELTEEEFEAIRIIDKEDSVANPYITPLCQLVKMANQLVSIELYRKYNEQNKENNY